MVAWHKETSSQIRISLVPLDSLFAQYNNIYVMIYQVAENSC